MAIFESAAQRRARVDKLAAEQADKQRQKVIDYKRWFAHPCGKEVLCDLINKFHVLNPTTGKDSREDAIQEGERRVVLYIMSKVNMDMKAFDKLLKGDFSV